MWQPIETAPKNTLILIWCPTINNGLPSCEVAQDCGGDEGRIWWTNGGPNGGSDFWFDLSDEPTHWMPLPEPPTA